MDFVVSIAIDLDPDYLRAWLRRAELYEQTEKLDEALEDYKKVLERYPNHSGARQACMVGSLTAGLNQYQAGLYGDNLTDLSDSHLSVFQRLPQQIQERNEKLKEEMISMYCTSKQHISLLLMCNTYCVTCNSPV